MARWHGGPVARRPEGPRAPLRGFNVVVPFHSSCHHLASLVTVKFLLSRLASLITSCITCSYPPPSRPPGAPKAQGPYTRCFFVLQEPLGPRGERPGPCHREATWHRNHCISCGKHICGSQFIVFASEIAHLLQNQCKVHPLIFV